MIPRSLLVRDRSQIGTYGNKNGTTTTIRTRSEGNTHLLFATRKSALSSAAARSGSSPTLLPVVSSSSYSSVTASNRNEVWISSKHSTNTKPQQQQQQTPKSTAEPVAPPARVSKAYKEWKRSYAGLLEFGTSLMGGTIGAINVLFLNGSYQSLILALLMPLVLSEVWEVYCLSSSASSTKETMLVHKIKQRIQLRYGQGLLMSAGLATILALKGGDDDNGKGLLLELFLRQIPSWISAWFIWTWLFYSGGKSRSRSSRSTTTKVSKDTAQSDTKAKKAIDSNFERKIPPRSYTA